MRSFGWIGASLVLLAAGACLPVPSLHPFYSPGEPVFDARLLGTWSNEDEARFVFSRSGKNSYLVSLEAEGNSYRLRGHLIRVAGEALLDLTPIELDEDAEAERLLIGHLLAVHSIHRLRFEGDVLELASLDDDWLDKRISRGEIVIGHARIDDVLVLTAPTRELRALLSRYAGDDEAFPSPFELRRGP